MCPGLFILFRKQSTQPPDLSVTGPGRRARTEQRLRRGLEAFNQPSWDL